MVDGHVENKYSWLTLLIFNAFDQSCSKTRTGQGGPGACTPGKILIFELWNGHFLRFQGEIHAKRAIKKRVIRGKFLILFLFEICISTKFNFISLYISTELKISLNIANIGRRKRRILYAYILIPCCNMIFHLELRKVNCSILY